MSTSFGWDFPYESRRAPVIARNVVATSQPLASQAGLQALARGGNAVDAILAAAITLTVVEPCSNGVGSDAFAQVFDGQSLHGYSGNGRSPVAWSPDRFNHFESMPKAGWHTVTVPGAVRTWVDLHTRYGRLDFSALFERAIHYARHGFHVGHKTAEQWENSLDRFNEYKPFVDHFSNAQGCAPASGELFKRPDLADTLEEISHTKGESFYTGSLADKIVSQASQEGGYLAREDLAIHEGRWTSPLHMDYNGVRVHELPPSGQGLAVLIALGILKHFDPKDIRINKPSGVHTQIEAMKIAIRAAFDHIADPDAMHHGVSVEELLDEQSLQRAANSITKTATKLPPLALPTSPDTVFLTAADESGMMVSYIQSNYMGFGSGIVVDGTGIALQNRGAGFVLTPDHPNQVDGAKKPYHTIIPGFVTTLENEPLAAFGVMGGHMQHQGHVQMVSRIYDHGENPQAASDASRWYVSPEFDVVLESPQPNEMLAELTAMGHNVTLSGNEGLFGGAQLIVRVDDGYIAASDHRKEGCAVGF